VSVGQKLVEKSLRQTGGYLDAVGTPSPGLLDEIQFVDGAIGDMVAQLETRGLLRSTLLIISAKHGQSPIDPQRLLRIPADDPAGVSPGDILGSLVAQATEDDISLLWLSDQSQTRSAITTLEANAAKAAIAEIFAGRALSSTFNDPLTDSRVPDVIVSPNVGVVYTGGKKKIAEHGGFAHDDTNVMLLVAHPRLRAATITTPVVTTQIAPSILSVLGLDPENLQAVRMEGTQPLPGFTGR
jgi:arylsulfatase A-like enzyme